MYEKTEDAFRRGTQLNGEIAGGVVFTTEKPFHLNNYQKGFKRFKLRFDHFRPPSFKTVEIRNVFKFKRPQEAQEQNRAGINLGDEKPAVEKIAGIEAFIMRLKEMAPDANNKANEAISALNGVPLELALDSVNFRTRSQEETERFIEELETNYDAVRLTMHREPHLTDYKVDVVYFVVPLELKGGLSIRSIEIFTPKGVSQGEINYIDHLTFCCPIWTDALNVQETGHHRKGDTLLCISRIFRGFDKGFRLEFVGDDRQAIPIEIRNGERVAFADLNTTISGNRHRVEFDKKAEMRFGRAQKALNNLRKRNAEDGAQGAQQVSTEALASGIGGGSTYGDGGTEVIGNAVKAETRGVVTASAAVGEVTGQAAGAGAIGKTYTPETAFEKLQQLQQQGETTVFLGSPINNLRDLNRWLANREFAINELRRVQHAIVERLSIERDLTGIYCVSVARPQATGPGRRIFGVVGDAAGRLPQTATAGQTTPKFLGSEVLSEQSESKDAAVGGDKVTRRQFLKSAGQGVAALWVTSKIPMPAEQISPNIEISTFLEAIEEKLKDYELKKKQNEYNGTTHDVDSLREVIFTESNLNRLAEYRRRPIEDTRLIYRIESLHNILAEELIENDPEVRRLREKAWGTFEKLSSEIPEGFNTNGSRRGYFYDILQYEPDRAKREIAQREWEAKISQATENDVKNLIIARNQAAQKYGYSDYLDFSSQRNRIDYTKVINKLTEAEVATRTLWEEALQAQAGRTGVPLNDMKTWDIWLLPQAMVGEAVELDKLWEADKALESIQKFLKDLGFNLDQVPLKIIYEQALVVQTVIFDPIKDNRIYMSKLNRQKFYYALLWSYAKILGQFYASRDKQGNLYAYSMQGPNPLLMEAISNFFADSVYLPEWMDRYMAFDVATQKKLSESIFYTLIRRVRLRQMKAEFEIRAYQDPAQDLNELYTTLIKKYLLIDDDTPLYGADDPFISGPMSYSRLAMGQIVSAVSFAFFQDKFAEPFSPRLSEVIQGWCRERPTDIFTFFDEEIGGINPQALVNWLMKLKPSSEAPAAGTDDKKVVRYLFVRAQPNDDVHEAREYLKETFAQGQPRTIAIITTELQNQILELRGFQQVSDKVMLEPQEGLSEEDVRDLLLAGITKLFWYTAPGTPNSKVAMLRRIAGEYQALVIETHLPRQTECLSFLEDLLRGLRIKTNSQEEEILNIGIALETIVRAVTEAGAAGLERLRSWLSGCVAEDFEGDHYVPVEIFRLADGRYALDYSASITDYSASITPDTEFHLLRFADGETRFLGSAGSAEYKEALEGAVSIAAAGGADSETERIRNKIEVLEGAIAQWTGNLKIATEAAMHHQTLQEGERNRIKEIQDRLQTLQSEIMAEQCKILLLENLAKIDKLRTQAQQPISVSVEDATDMEEYKELRQSLDYNYEGQQELLILIAEEIKVIAEGKKVLIIGPVDRQRAILAGSLRWLGFVVLPPARDAEEAKPNIKYADLIINNTNQPSGKVLEQIGVPIEARQAILANVLTFSGLDLLEIDDAKEKVLLEIAEWV